MMKSCFVLLALFGVALSAKMALDQSIINEVNAKGSWKAGTNKRFMNVTLADAAKLCGTKLDMTLNIPVGKFEEPLDLPTNFDSRQKWGAKIHPIRNQEQCGSCWAFGATEALSDRIAIQGGPNIVLSPQDLVSCDKPSNYGCEGGYLNLAWQFMQTTGVVSDECYPYTSGNGVDGVCQKRCTGRGFTWGEHKSQAAQMFTTVQDIMQEVYTNGPVEVAFSVYQDFFSYSGGVYQHESGSLAGGHAVKLIGWGVDTSTNQDYWLIANSWGADWGLQGFFMILKGVNECGIESNVIAGKAAL
jgi:cathepsin B